MTNEQRETIQIIKGTVRQIYWDGGARCRLCDEWFAGSSLDEVLRKLGEHGENEHPEVFRGE